MRILFLAPLKAPDHPVPSGDRTIARLFWQMLEGMGYKVELASRLRSYNPAPDEAHWHSLTQQAEAEITRIVAEANAKLHPPIAAVFCYHLYYKAPDMLGPALAAALDVPYLIAEASHAPRRKREALAAHNTGLAHAHELVEQAIRAARLLITPSAVDREMLVSLVSPHPAHSPFEEQAFFKRPMHTTFSRQQEKEEGGEQAILDLKPFLDLSLWAKSIALPRPQNTVPRFLTVAMMRKGDKLASYQALALALLPLQSAAWTLDLVGDGTARGAVEAAFAPFGNRIRFLGALEGEALGKAYMQADAFLWPAINEAFGMVFLEAQAHGLPVIAGDYGGVSEVMRHGETGILTPRGDGPVFTNAVARLLSQPAERVEMGRAARLFIAQERDVTQAASKLHDAFKTCKVGGN